MGGPPRPPANAGIEHTLTVIEPVEMTEVVIKLALTVIEPVEMTAVSPNPLNSPH